MIARLIIKIRQQRQLLILKLYKHFMENGSTEILSIDIP